MRDPSVVTAMPRGPLPAGSVVTTVFIAVSMTVTSLVYWLLVYANGDALALTAPAKTIVPSSHSVSRLLIRAPLAPLRPPVWTAGLAFNLYHLMVAKPGIVIR